MERKFFVAPVSCCEIKPQGSFFSCMLKGAKREVKIKPARDTDLGHKVVFWASKFQKSLAWWLLIRLIRCPTLHRHCLSSLMFLERLPANIKLSVPPLPTTIFLHGLSDHQYPQCCATWMLAQEYKFANYGLNERLKMVINVYLFFFFFFNAWQFLHH